MSNHSLNANEHLHRPLAIRYRYVLGKWRNYISSFRSWRSYYSILLQLEFFFVWILGFYIFFFLTSWPMFSRDIYCVTIPEFVRISQSAEWFRTFLFFSVALRPVYSASVATLCARGSIHCISLSRLKMNAWKGDTNGAAKLMFFFCLPHALYFANPSDFSAWDR